MVRNKLDRREFGKNLGLAGCLTLLAASDISAAQEIKSIEEIAKELGAKTARFLPMYGSCAQSSFAAMNAQFELQLDRVIAAMMPFTGGIAGKGETCGALSGSLLAMGFLIDSNAKLKRQPDSAMQLGAVFFDRFEKRFGSTHCREIVKRQYGRYFDFSKPEETKAFLAEEQKNSRCLEVVTTAVRLASEIILEHS